jgi:hypothetical protein
MRFSPQPVNLHKFRIYVLVNGYGISKFNLAGFGEK